MIQNQLSKVCEKNNIKVTLFDIFLSAYGLSVIKTRYSMRPNCLHILSTNFVNNTLSLWSV